MKIASPRRADTLVMKSPAFGQRATAPPPAPDGSANAESAEPLSSKLKREPKDLVTVGCLFVFTLSALQGGEGRGEVGV